LTALVGAGTASAGGVFCDLTENNCPSKWNVNQILDFKLEAGTSAELVTTENKVVTTCAASTLETELVSNPDGESEATGRNAALTWGNGTTFCDLETTTIELGKLKFANIAGTFNGTVKADALIKITVESETFGKCVYGIEAGTDMGELKEGKVELGSTSPTFKLNVVMTKRASAEDPCLGGPTTLRLIASYIMETPLKTTLAITAK
jgi:hypothetical protein